MRWPFGKLDTFDTPEVATLTARISELETRADSSYTDALVSALQRNAQGRVANPSSPYATGALETCAGLVGRAFAAAEITGPEQITDALTPELMTLIGRSLIRKGEIVFAIDTSTGRLRLKPAASHNVAGGPDPDSWDYELSLPGPSETMTVALPAASVLHLRYAADPETPWRGIGPIQQAYLAGELSAEVVKALADETSGPRGSLLPLPGADGDDATVDKLKGDIRSANGSLLLVESMADAWESGGSAPQGDWLAKRFGPSPPASMVELMQTIRNEIFSACGVPPGMFVVGAAASIRESWRLCLFGLIGPCGRIVLSELRSKLDGDLNVGWDELRASDVQGRARAFQSLVGGGMDMQQAITASGLLVSDDD